MLKSMLVYFAILSGVLLPQKFVLSKMRTRPKIEKFILSYISNTKTDSKGACIFDIRNSSSTTNESSNLSFDLSVLPRTNIPVGMNYTIYLSVCEMYVNFDTKIYNPCPDNALICLLSNEFEFFNIGDKLIDATIDDFGELTIIFEGDKCKINHSVNYHTTIRFIPTDMALQPRILETGNDCEISIDWHSWESKPISDVSYRNLCLYRNRALQYTLDLRKFRHPRYYIVDGGVRRFQVNICGSIKEGACKGDDVTICEVTDPKNPVALAYLSNKIEIVGLYNDLRIVHPMQKKPKTTRVEISIICNRSPLSRNIFFDTTKGKPDVLRFTVENDVSCIPSKVQCEFESNENLSYNLNYLRKSVNNYIIYKDLHAVFYMNICGTLNREDLPGQCQGEGVFVCLYNTNNNSARAYRVDPEEIEHVNRGHLRISVVSHEKCNDEKHFRADISLQCISLIYDDESKPIYDENNDDPCVVKFIWKTSHACPIEHDVGDGDCTVKITYPAFTNLNLTSLRNVDDDYTVSGLKDTDEFRINVCGPLLKPCGRSEVASVCWINGNKEFVAGRQTKLLTYEDGVLYFRMMGDRCWDNGPFSKVVIKILCSNNENKPRVVEMFENKCGFIIEWYTKKACDEDEKYSYCDNLRNKLENINIDLSNLTDMTDNHVAEQGQDRIFFNICRPVMRRRGVFCPWGSSVCKVIYAKNDSLYKSFSLGDIAHMTGYVDENITLIYNSSSICQGSENLYYSSVLHISCDPHILQAKLILSIVTNCTYHFELKTRNACTTEFLDEIDHTPVRCPKMVHLNKISSRIYNASSYKTRTHKFVICGYKNICGAGIGVCTYTDDNRIINSGRFRNVTYESSGLIGNQTVILKFTYDNGDICVNDSSKRYSTIIEMRCGDQRAGPFVVAENPKNCSTVISFVTPLACFDNNIYPCIKYEKKSMRQELNIFENINTPIGHIIPTTCPFWHACPVRNKNCKEFDSSGRVPYKIIGFQTSSLTINDLSDEPVFYMTFADGFLCPSPSFLKNRSHGTLQLMCNYFQNSDITDVVMKIPYSCNYEFLWKTWMFCTNEPLEIYSRSRCSIKRGDGGMDLKSLEFFKEGPIAVGMYNLKKYNFNLCDTNETFCPNGTNVCARYINGTIISYGRIVRSVRPIYSEASVLVFDHGDRCGYDDRYRATLHVICNESNHDNNIRIVNESACTAKFVWSSYMACSGHRNNRHIFADTPNISNFSITAIIVSVITTTVVGILIVYFCRRGKRNLSLKKYNRLARSDIVTRLTEENELGEEICLVQFGSDTNMDTASNRYKNAPRNLETAFRT